LLPQEAQMVEMKYAAKRFGLMNDTEIDLAATKLIITVSVITGWTPPPGEFCIALEAQLVKKIRESYQFLNMEEVEYAFRQKALNMKDWGKVINISMLDDVLARYLDERFDLSHQEERVRMTPAIEQKKELSPEEWEEWLAEISCEKQLNKIPSVSYDYLAKIGKINLTPKEKNSLMLRAVDHVGTTIFSDINTREGAAFLKMKKSGEYSAEVTGTLITFAKRIAVFDYYTNNPPMQEAGGINTL